MELKTMKDKDKVKQRLNSWNHQIVEESLKVKELPCATIEAKDIVGTYVEKETSNEDFCDSISEKNIEIKENERAEEKERFIERLYYTSLVDPNMVGFELDCALFAILHDECLGKFIENVDYAFPFLDACMKNLDKLLGLNGRFRRLPTDDGRLPPLCPQ
ncbi:hypothetical protein M9H77_12987 [Catharanthus roseus]|uniref:Uncharacterized protein n=1 Tax=Catharanthus roseus TaxID=4058 RepID=A0ACC0BJ53_CATRO|nr:hypothetical protein M9H77_12987 [Catharanthus roseus]